MNGRNESRNKNILIGALLAVVLVMGVGYAAFAQQLTITGNANITSTWDVKITDIKETSANGATSENVTFNDNSATFTTKLTSPGDTATYTVTITNAGTLDAVVSSYQFTDSDNSAIQANVSGISQGSKITAEQDTLQFTVTITYNPAVETQPSDLDTTVTLNLSFAQDGVQ